MKALLYGVLTVAVIGAGPLARPAHAQAAATSDHSLDSRITARMHRDPVLKHYDVDVSVDNGVVKLTGTVPTEAARTKAVHLATMSGVARVDNQLMVDPTVHRKGTTGTVAEKTKHGGEKATAGLAKAGEKTTNAVSKTGEVITDSWITTRVKSKFLDEGVLKGSDIHVETTNQVVTLTGTVLTEAGRARAVEQAKEVEGVHHVVDHLMIGPKK